MRSRVHFLSISLVVGAFVMPLAAHAGIPFFGPIIPTEYNTCPGSWGLIVTVVNRTIEFVLTLAIVFVAPIMIGYAGLLYVANPLNPAGLSKAKGLLQNVAGGIVIALAAWLIVDAVMAVFYHPTDTSWSKTWSNIITSGGIDPCLLQSASLHKLNQVDTSGAQVTGIGGNGGRFLTLPTNGDCRPETIQAAAKAGGYELTQAQANTLACIAVPESSCGANTTGARQANGTPTSASGMFQVVFGYDDQCHNLNIPSCTAAAEQAGYSTSGNLNCSKHFKGGKPIPNDPQAQACLAASANLTCNAAAAACLVQLNHGSYSAWTGTGDGNSHATQQNCVTQYANS